MSDLIKRSDAIEAIEVVDWYHQNRNKDMVSGANDDEHQAWYKADDIYKALESIPSARPKGEWTSVLAELHERFDALEKEMRRASAEMSAVIREYVDRPQGKWTKTDIATYRCSECGKIQIADDINELNFCCCCGSRNKIRRMKGADDEADNNKSE